MHGLQDHAKVNKMAETKYSGTMSIEQNKSANFQSFTDFQKTKSTPHYQIQNLAKTKIVLESMRNIIHTTKTVFHNSNIFFLRALTQTLGGRCIN